VLRHFFHWPRRIDSVETRGRQGESGAYRGLRHDGTPVQDCEERGEGDEEKCWKSGGGRVCLYTWRRAGLADEGGSDAILDAVGGEDGHGAAKPDGVIHRYRVNTLHLIIHELPVILVVPMAIEVPASVRGGDAQTQNLGWWSCQDRPPHPA
jgi:hypothetical protein